MVASNIRLAARLIPSEDGALQGVAHPVVAVEVEQTVAVGSAMRTAPWGPAGPSAFSATVRPRPTTSGLRRGHGRRGPADGPGVSQPPVATGRRPRAVIEKDIPAVIGRTPVANMASRQSCRSGTHKSA